MLPLSRNGQNFRISGRECCTIFVSPYYHASELEAFWRSDVYKRTVKDRATLIKLQAVAFPLIKEHTLKGVAVAVIKKDFLEIIHPRAGAKELYSFCAQECMRGMKFWFTRERRTTGVVNYVFSHGAPGWGIFEKQTETPAGRAAFKVGTITRADMRELLPLQAADVLAFEAYKEMVNGVVYRRRNEPRPHPPRQSAMSLIRPRKDFVTYFDAKRLTDIFIRKLKRPELFPLAKKCPRILRLFTLQRRAQSGCRP